MTEDTFHMTEEEMKDMLPDPAPETELPALSSTPPALETSLQTTREEFGAVERRPMAETASTAAAAAASAEVQARYVMAMRNPRSLDRFRQNLLLDCKRPTFAAMAEYAKPIGGKKVTGPSIRMVEAALRHYGNFYADKRVLYDDKEKRVISCCVTDLESNGGWPVTAVVDKTVERSQPRQGAAGPEFISSRTNSYGKLVYLVEATEDDMLNKENAAASKALRNSGLRVLPADIVEEAMDACAKTLADRDAKDPDAAKKAIIDAFGNIGVPVSELKAYLGHELSTSSPSEIKDLRGIYTAVKEGAITWAEVMTNAAEPTTTAKTGTAKLKERIAKK